VKNALLWSWGGALFAVGRGGINTLQAATALDPA